MERSDEKTRGMMIEYLARMLRANGVSLETTKGILRFISQDTRKMKALMDWLVEYQDMDLTESQIIHAMGEINHYYSH